MWTFYGLAEIGALTGNVARRWRNQWTSDAEENEGAHAGLLSRRMSALGVDSETFARLEPALFGNLQTLCHECERPNLCRQDLRHSPNGPAWEDYCANAVVLNAVKELRWFGLTDNPNGRR